MQVETPEVSAQKATTPRYDTIVIRGATGKTIPKEVDGGEVVAWSLGHELAALDALEYFVDNLAAGNCLQPTHLTRGAAEARNLMRRRRVMGWDADTRGEQQPLTWRDSVAFAEATARMVFTESDDTAGAIDYMAGLMLAHEPGVREPFMFVRMNQDDVEDWTQDANRAEEWESKGHIVARLYKGQGGAV
ncbi:hypothetical protein [Pseudomonas japonica]|uniref:hypothetical protein n=1 Tax=Pseudomonas japonica TaxID=256466 RepID=UPI003A8792C8